MDEKPRKCFGTKEYSQKSLICKQCKHYIDCEKESINYKIQRLKMRILKNEI